MSLPASCVPERTANWHLGSGGIAVWVYNRATGAVVAANDSATHVYGGDLHGRHIDQVLAHAHALLRDTHESVSWVGPLVHVRTDGSTFVAEVGLLSSGRAHTLVLVSPEEDALGEHDEEQAPRR